MSRTTIVTTSGPHPATEPGALEHWAVDCRQCGPKVLTTSMKTMVDRLADEHAGWHLRRCQEETESLTRQVAQDLWEVFMRPHDPGSADGQEILNNFSSTLSILADWDVDGVQIPESVRETTRQGVIMFLQELGEPGSNS